jgi:DNA-directed RNA polymerase subunit RPC12/RpoP
VSASQAGPRRGATGLPPVPVTCRACGHEWTSTAKQHSSIACPACGHHARVKRYPPAAAQVPAGPPPQPEPQAPRPAPHPAAPADSPGYPETDDDDDGETWLLDASGALVVGEWTRDGQLVPAPPAHISYPAELTARRWEIRPNPAGVTRCHVILPPPPGAPAGTPPRHCLGLARHDIPGGTVCDACMDAIGRPLAH